MEENNNQAGNLRKKIGRLVSTYVAGVATALTVYLCTKPSPCKSCLECSVIKNRETTLMTQSQKLKASESFLEGLKFKRKGTLDSIDSIRVRNAKITYYLKEIAEIKKQLKSDKDD